MLVKILNGYYERSDSAISQGGTKGLFMNQGYYELRGGNGTYIMAKPSTAKLTFEVDGQIMTQSVKNIIRNYYGCERVTKKKFDQFMFDCCIGEIQLFYDYDIGLYIG